MGDQLISIIIPCFNAEKYIGEAIQSALDQTYVNKEIIVIDDGSTDESLAVIKTFGDLVRWESGPNRGGGTARNRGLTLANGEYIQFQDADDLLDKTKLAIQMPIILKRGADVVYSDYRQFRMSCPEKQWNISLMPQSQDAVLLALQKQNIQTNAALIKKKALLRIGGFREDLPCCQERDLFLRLACSGASFVHVPVVLHSVRLTEGSVSSDEVRVYMVLNKLLHCLYSELEKGRQLDDERRKAFSILMAATGRRLLRLNRPDIAEAHFAKALKMHPSGGLNGAYSRIGCLIAKVLGPVKAEKVLSPFKKIF